MAQERVQKRRGKVREEEAESGAAKAGSEVAEKADETLADIDDVLEDQLDAELLADIDDALEENAEEFVNNYVQAGGE